MEDHMKHRLAAVTIVSAGSLLGVTLIPAHGVPLAVHDDSASEAVESYARDNSTDVLAAAAALEDQTEIAREVRDSGIELGVDADIWIDHEGEAQQVWIRTEHIQVADAFERLSLSEETSVTVVDDPPIVEQVPALTDEVEAVVRIYAPGVQGMYVRLADGALIVESTDIPEEVNTDAIATASGFAVVVAEQVEPASDSILTRGGVGLSSCTAGFSARNGSTYIGVFSAAHCGTSQRVYTNTAGTGSYVTGTRTLKVHNANADIGFYRIPSGHFVSSSFYGSSSSSATNMGSPQDVPVGITACHRGKTRGWKCGEITSISYRPTWAGACPNTTCNAVFVRASAEQAGGDSGGPWVNGSAPIGIHKGGASGWSVYSKISRIPSGTSLYY
jgi:hypothetical protein